MCKICYPRSPSYYQDSQANARANVEGGSEGNGERVMKESQCDFCAAWVWKGECDNRIYVDYRPNCFAQDSAGAHEAPGGPHREDRCDRARVCGVATLSPSLGG